MATPLPPNKSKNNMDEFEYLIFLPVRRFITILTRICRWLLTLSLCTGLVGVALLFIGIIGFGFFALHLSDLLFEILLILMSILLLWCHNVLLAARGHHLTRFLAGFTTIMAAIYTACIVYSTITGERLLLKQDILSTILPLFILICVLTNLNFMAAASRRLRTSLCIFAMGLFCAGLTLAVLPLHCLIFKMIAFFCGYRLLCKLENIAPRIISMPERH